MAEHGARPAAANAGLAGRRRIAVLLGSGSSDRRVLEAVLPLLEREPGADLLGVFVDEAGLQAAAELPFVKELCRITCSVREFHAVDAQRDRARRMHTAQVRFEQAAVRTGASFSFRSASGPALALLRETLGAADVTLFEPARATALARIFAEEGAPAPRRRVAVVLDDAETAAEALQIGLLLAGHRPQRLALLLTPAAARDMAPVERLLETRLAGARVAIDRLDDESVRSMIAGARRLGAGCLVLTAGGGLLNDEALRVVREEAPCPVVMVRRAAAGETGPASS